MVGVFTTSVRKMKGCHTERSRSMWSGLCANPSTTLRVTPITHKLIEVAQFSEYPWCFHHIINKTNSVSQTAGSAW